MFKTHVKGYDYEVSFMVEEDWTFCNITDPVNNFVVLSGHTQKSSYDEPDAVEGMKKALEKAFNNPPTLFFKEERTIIWDDFWAFVKDFEWEEIDVELEEDDEDFDEDDEEIEDLLEAQLRMEERITILENMLLESDDE